MSSSQTTTSRWILHPVIDLLFCCGGIVWILFAVQFFIFPQSFGTHAVAQDPFPILGLLGTILLGDAHNVVSLHRLYSKPTMRNKFWFISYVIPVITMLLALTSMFVPALLSVLSKLYLILIVQHVMGQLYGLAVLYCCKFNYKLNGLELRSLQFLVHTLTAYAIASQFAFPDNFRQSFFGTPLPVWGGLPPTMLCAMEYTCKAAAVMFCLVVMKKAVLEKAVLPLPAMMLIVSGAIVAVFAQHASGVLSLYIPAFFHGSQYLCIGLACFLQEHGEQPRSMSLLQLLFGFQTLRYWARLLVGIVAIFMFAPQLLSMTLHVPYAVTFLAVFLGIQFHHFAIDMAIWRIRRPEVRQELVAIQQEAVQVSAPLTN